MSPSSKQRQKLNVHSQWGTGKPDILNYKDTGWKEDLNSSFMSSAKGKVISQALFPYQQNERYGDTKMNITFTF